MQAKADDIQIIHIDLAAQIRYHLSQQYCQRHRSLILCPVTSPFLAITGLCAQSHRLLRRSRFPLLLPAAIHPIAHRHLSIPLPQPDVAAHQSPSSQDIVLLLPIDECRYSRVFKVESSAKKANKFREKDRQVLKKVSTGSPTFSSISAPLLVRRGEASCLPHLFDPGFSSCSVGSQMRAESQVASA